MATFAQNIVRSFCPAPTFVQFLDSQPAVLLLTIGVIALVMGAMALCVIAGRLE